MIEFETKQTLNGVTFVSVFGNLNDDNRSHFFEYLKSLFEDGANQVVVDCEGLGSVSSGGLAILLATRRQAQTEGGKIILTNVNSLMMEVLTKTKLNSLLQIYPSTTDLLCDLHLQVESALPTASSCPIHG